MLSGKCLHVWSVTYNSFKPLAVTPVSKQGQFNLTKANFDHNEITDAVLYVRFYHTIKTRPLCVCVCVCVCLSVCLVCLSEATA